MSDDSNSYEKKGSFASFLEKKIKVDSDKLSVLLGNGLITSHPIIGNEFRFDSDYVVQEFNKRVSGILEDHSLIHSPEGLLKVAQLELSIIIFNFYLKKLGRNISNLTNGKLSEFLRKFGSIFTLNYDPVLYMNLLNKGGSIIFVDGLNIEGKHFCKIKETLESDKIKIYFLHGAYHILSSLGKNDGCPIYQKVKNDRSLNKNEQISFLESIKNNLEKLHNDYINYGSEWVENDITTVLSPRFYYKKAEIDNDVYLNYCRAQLAKVKKLFIFGCSFEFDIHIIETLALGECEELYISFLSKHSHEYSDTKKNFYKAISKLLKYRYNKQQVTTRNDECDSIQNEIKQIREFKQKPIWVETSDFSDCIWE